MHGAPATAAGSAFLTQAWILILGFNYIDAFSDCEISFADQRRERYVDGEGRLKFKIPNGRCVYIPGVRLRTPGQVMALHFAQLMALCENK